MALPIFKLIYKFTALNIRMIQKGIFLDSYRIYRANPAEADGQQVILKLAPKVINKINYANALHQIILGQLSEAYLRRQEFDKAASNYETALDMFHQCTPNVIDQLLNYSYLTQRLATCYRYLGKRKEAVDIIKEAVLLGVPPNNFVDLLDEDKIPELEKLIEPEP
jgi:tetratricopeptide (TPR) repeat protein